MTPRRRDSVALVWAGGLALAAVLYLVGPDRFMERLSAAIARAAAWLDQSLQLMSIAGFELLRSAAIAVFAVFVALCLIARRRGQRSRGRLLAVSVPFLLLVAPGPPGSAPRWLLALVLAATGAGTTTRRLLRPAPPAPR